MDAALVLLAGESGSGKSHLARVSGCTRFRLDEFYLDGDAAGLPRAHGIVDWDDPATWDGAAALDALVALIRTGRTVTPDYDISTSRRVGEREVTLADPGPGRRVVIVAEGIFAPELVRPARALGLDVTGIWLHRPRLAIFALRLVRDLRQRRKPPLVLVRRGWNLLVTEPVRRRRALAKGCVSLSMTQARRTVARLGSCPPPPPPAPASPAARATSSPLARTTPSPDCSAASPSRSDPTTC